jgi:hypothetical protein
MTVALAFLFLIFVGLPGAFMAGCAFQRTVDRERRGGYLPPPAAGGPLVGRRLGEYAHRPSSKQWRGGRLR